MLSQELESADNVDDEIPKDYKDLISKTINEMIHKCVESLSILKVNASQKKDKNQVATSLKYFNGTLYDYQLEGVTWLVNSYIGGFNSVLADESGLGKTVQIIALISFMLAQKLRGPYLIICPSNEMSHWEGEFRRFAPKIPIGIFHDDSCNEKPEISDAFKKHHFFKEYVRAHMVIITSYEMIMHNIDFFQELEYEYLILDVGKELKSRTCKIFKLVLHLKTCARLLLTSAPLQRNIQELWLLLQYIMPLMFISAPPKYIRNIKFNKLLDRKQKSNYTSMLYEAMARYVLRRLKKDVTKDMLPKNELKKSNKGT